MKKTNILFILVLIASFVLPTTVFAGQEKTSVCHITGAYDFGNGSVAIGHVITIANPALPAHMKHGDATEYQMQTLPDGDIVCTPNIDSDGDGVPNSADACDNPGALAMLDAAGIAYTITTDGCIVISGSLPYAADLSGIDLSGSSLRSVNLNGVNLTGADLSGADLYGTTGASVGGSSRIIADGANFSGANLNHSYLYGSSFVNADLSDASINEAYLVAVDLTGADLSGATFDNTYCPDGKFSGAGGTCIGHL